MYSFTIFPYLYIVICTINDDNVYSHQELSLTVQVEKSPVAATAVVAVRVSK